MTPVFARLCAALRRFSLGEKSFTVAALGYIAAADAEGGGDFPLGQGHGSSKTIPQTDDFRLPWSQLFTNQSPQPQGTVTVMDVVQHGIIHAHHIH